MNGRGTYYWGNGNGGRYEAAKLPGEKYGDGGKDLAGDGDRDEATDLAGDGDRDEAADGGICNLIAYKKSFETSISHFGCCCRSVV